jgi:adenylate cyclase
MQAGSPGRVERRLAAILAADVAGYSRLMGEDEAGTLARLRTHRRELIDPQVAEHKGRVVKTTGDGILIELPSGVEAVACAVAVQKGMAERNTRTPEHQRIVFRVGINLGDVIVEDGDIHGDGVNIAARLEALAEPGEVCVSALVHDQVQGRLDCAFDDLGEQRLKNIARRMRVYRVAKDATPGAAPLQAHHVNVSPDARGQAAPVAGSARSSRPSIAVLPFFEYGSAAELLIGDGIAEDVVSALASLPDLFVISRNSTLRYRAATHDIRTIGRELGVRYVLSGSVRRGGDRVRISAELVDSESLAVIITDRIESTIDDPFQLQDRLTERVLQTIAPHLRVAEVRRARSKRTENLDAYEYHLRGLDLLYRLEQTEFEQARKMFELSIGLDPNYAAPYAFTALWHSIRILRGWSPNASADLKSVGEFASAALLRDQSDVWALLLSGHLHALLFRDFDTAFELFERALRTSPNSAFAWARSAPAFNYIGETAEARRRAEEALRLSPFDPHIFFMHCTLSIAAYLDGDYEKSVAWGRRAHAENPIYPATLRVLSAALAANGLLNEARRIGESLCRLEPHFQVSKFLESYARQEERF